MASMASAATTVRITGSSAYRAAVTNAILHLLNASSGIQAVYTNFGSAAAPSSLGGANQQIIHGFLTTGGTEVYFKTSWSGSLSGLIALTTNSTTAQPFLSTSNINTSDSSQTAAPGTGADGSHGPTGGKILRPSDGKEAKNIAFIQCAGSRDENHLRHCSRICCMASLKQTHYVREKYPEDGKSTIYYIDIRAIDRFEDFYQKVQADPSVSFIKSKVAKITEDEQGNPVCWGVNTEGYKRYTTPHDLVVLAVGMEPSVKGINIPGHIVADSSGFIEADPANGAVFGAGCASNALDVNRAVQSATAAALRAIQVVNKVAKAEA